jgi:hypothetical protein
VGHGASGRIAEKSKVGKDKEFLSWGFLLANLPRAGFIL